ncbi:MAG TPA: hypothetical protein VFX70_22620 [Mycobacteriales bacterium]|nr:hypothetical protein [Mycobacteriales bacterium]
MSGDTVLVLTAPDDPTADLVVRELGRRDTTVFRADLAWFPTRLTMTARAGGPWTGVLRLPDRAVRLRDIISVYYRRPNSYALSAVLSEGDRAWADTEARHGLGGVLTALDCLWLPDPVTAARAELKPVQLAAAAQVGLHIPDTLITNDPTEAADFVASQPGGAVYKPLFGRPTTHDGQPESLYTTTVTTDAITPAVAYTAHMFQAKVPKAYVLVGQARDRLAAIGYRPTLVAADGLAGWPDGAPYDRILGTCSTRRVPAAWLAQIRAGGMIVANVGQGVVPLRVDAGGSASGWFLPGPASFIEARPADAPDGMPFDAAVDLVYAQGDSTRSADPLVGIGDEAFWFVVHVVMPGHVWFELHEDDNTTYCLVDPMTRSWYRATRAADRMTVTQAGSRRVWDDLAAIHVRWEAANHPSHDRLGLTVTPAGRHTLWVDEPGRRAWTLV